MTEVVNIPVREFMNAEMNEDFDTIWVNNGKTYKMTRNAWIQLCNLALNNGKNLSLYPTPSTEEFRNILKIRSDLVFGVIYGVDEYPVIFRTTTNQYVDIEFEQINVVFDTFKKLTGVEPVFNIVETQYGIEIIGKWEYPQNVLVVTKYKTYHISKVTFEVRTSNNASSAFRFNAILNIDKAVITVPIAKVYHRKNDPIARIVEKSRNAWERFGLLVKALSKIEIALNTPMNEELLMNAKYRIPPKYWNDFSKLLTAYEAMYGRTNTALFFALLDISNNYGLWGLTAPFMEDLLSSVFQK